VEETDIYKEFKFVTAPPSEKFKKFIGNSNGMFVIETDKMESGNFINWREKYRLRHLLTN